jgi:hypothetical protein
MGRPEPLFVNIPVETETTTRNRVAVTGATYVEGKGIVIDIDARRKNWRKLLRRLGHDIPKATEIHWENLRCVEIQELSSFNRRFCYRVTFGDGWYLNRASKRVYFGVEQGLPGLDLQRGVSTTTVRAGVMLAIMAGVGLRSICWLLHVLFHVEVSKSALGRWVEETASRLPNRDEIMKLLNAEKRITEAHLDEIYPKGWGKGCVLVLKDEHGRIVCTEEILERSTEHVVPFLETLKHCGLAIQTFYVDGCEAYREAIRISYPEARVQYDYFHILQNIWKKLWRAMVAHRKDLKQRSEEVDTPWYSQKLKKLAAKLWDHRGLIFKSEDNITPEEMDQLVALMEEDPFVGVVRRFLDRVWGIFRDSKGALGARQRLGKLSERAEVIQDPDGPFAKAVAFLHDRFEDMTTFLRFKDVKRNSLQESGIRVLRRLEAGHDGFRGDKGRDNYVRIYQAIKYFDWRVYRIDGSLALPPRPPAASA